jgi:hypothetical protein
VKRARHLQCSCSSEVVYDNGDQHADSISALSDLIAPFEVAGHVSAQESNVDVHHDRLRYAWKEMQTGILAVTGIDYVSLSADGRLQHIVGFNDPLPTQVTLDATMQAFLDAFSSAEVTARLALLEEAFASKAIFVDPQRGVLDVDGLSRKIDASRAAYPTARISFTEFQEYRVGFRIAWTASKGTPDHGVYIGIRGTDGHIAEVTEFDGDLVPTP